MGGIFQVSRKSLQDFKPILLMLFVMSRLDMRWTMEQNGTIPSQFCIRNSGGAL